MNLTFVSSGDIFCVNYPIENDTLCEDDESFNVFLSDPNSDSAINIDPASASVTIIDDDGKSLLTNRCSSTQMVACDITGECVI